MNFAILERVSNSISQDGSIAMSTDRDVVGDLLDEWEERRATYPSADRFLADHCPDSPPEVVAEFRRRAGDLLAIDSILGSENDDKEDSAQNTAPEPSLGVGEKLSVISECEVSRFHARGGLGEVHVAHDTALGRSVAVKVIQKDRAKWPLSRRRFEREAEITGQLEHPGIVPIYGVGSTTGGGIAYVMRFVEGDTFREAIERFYANTRSDPEQRLAFRQLLSRFVAVCNTMDYAHSRGVIHRDIKPSNILIGKHGETLVVDWGLAKRIGETEDDEAISDSETPSRQLDERLTETGNTLGTPAYMSPEQTAGDNDRVRATSDVFSLGATLFEMLTGRSPTLTGSRRIPALRPLNTRIPRPLEAVCLKAMSINPEDRYETAGQLADEVERWLADEPVQAWREPWPVRMRRWITRHRTVVATTVVGIVIASTASAIAVVLLSTAWGNERIAKELAEKREAEAITQRDQATRNFAWAQEAVDRFFTRVSEDHLLNQSGMQPLRKQLLGLAANYYDKFIIARPSDANSRKELAEAYRRLARITAITESESAAIPVLEKGIDAFRKLADANPDVLEYRIGLASCLTDLGRYRRVVGDRLKCDEAYKAAIDELARLEQVHPSDERVNKSLAAVRANYSGYLGDEERFVEAKEFLEQALASYRKLETQTPGAFQLSIADLVGNLAVLARREGNEKAAQLRFKEALDLHERYASIHKDELLARQRLGRSRYNLAASYQRTSDDSSAEKLFDQAVKVQQPLADSNPEDAKIQHEYAQTLSELGLLHEGHDRTDKAVRNLVAAVKIQLRLATLKPDVTAYKAELADTWDTLAMVYERSNMLSAAKQASERALVVRDGLAKQFPSDANHQSQLGLTVGFLAGIVAKTGKHDDALLWHRTSIRHLEAALKLRPASPDVVGSLQGVKIDMARSLFNVGKLLEAEKTIADAIAMKSGVELPASAHLLHARIIAEQGRVKDAAKVIAGLDTDTMLPTELFDAADVHAVLAGKPTASPGGREEQQRHVAAAVLLLRRIFESRAFPPDGFLRDIEADAALGAIRDDLNFRRLLADIKSAGNASPADATPIPPNTPQN